MKPSPLIPIKTDTVIVASSPVAASQSKLPFPIPFSSLRFREPVQRSVRILGKRAFRQNLQVLRVVFPGFGFISQFFLAHGETEAGDGVVVLVVKSFLVAIERGFVVLALEIIVADLTIFQRLHRVPGMELLHAGGLNVLRDVEVRDRSLAARMVLGVVLGRAGIDPCVVAGTLLIGGLATLRGSFVRRSLVRTRLIWRFLRQRKSRQQRQEENQESDAHILIVSLLRLVVPPVLLCVPCGKGLGPTVESLSYPKQKNQAAHRMGRPGLAKSSGEEEKT